MYFVGVSEGFVTMDADSKAEVVAVAAPFFPYWTQEIYELTPWSEAKDSILGSVRQLVST